MLLWFEGLIRSTLSSFSVPILHSHLVGEEVALGMTPSLHLVVALVVGVAADLVADHGLEKHPPSSASFSVRWRSYTRAARRK